MGKFEYLKGSEGKEVRHKMLGKGIITACNTDNGILTVMFRNNTINVQFPQSFRDGIIEFVISSESIKEELEASPYYQMVDSSESDSWASDEEDASWADNANKKEKQKNSGGTVRTKSKETNNPYDDWDDPQARKCDTCIEMKRGDCAGLRNAKTCKDYLPIPYISNAEKYNWRR